MPPAIIGGVIAAAGTIGGAVLSGRSQSRAAEQASDAQLQVARENNDLAREFRDENQANFQPWLNSGTRANSLIDSFLYGPQAAPAPATVGPATPAPATGGGHPVTRPSGPMSLGQFVRYQNEVQAAGDIGRNPGQAGQGMVNGHGVQGAPYAGMTGGTPVTGTGTGTSRPGTPAPGAPAGNAMSGYEQFVNSPYYQNPLQEGYRALNSGLASGGMLQSGDAMKRATRYGQDYGYGRMMEYIGLAGQQSDRGLQGAGAIAGVGLNAMNSISGNNQNAANALSNSAIARGNANSNMYAGIGNALGTFAGQAFGGSSYNSPGANNVYGTPNPTGGQWVS